MQPTERRGDHRYARNWGAIEMGEELKDDSANIVGVFTNTLLVSIAGLILAEIGVRLIFRLWGELVWATDDFTLLVIGMFITFIVRSIIAAIAALMISLGFTILVKRSHKMRPPSIAMSVVLSICGSLVWAFYQIAKDVYAP
jgi:hypothetical protein